MCAACCKDILLQHICAGRGGPSYQQLTFLRQRKPRLPKPETAFPYRIIHRKTVYMQNSLQIQDKNPYSDNIIHITIGLYNGSEDIASTGPAQKAKPQNEQARNKCQCLMIYLHNINWYVQQHKLHVCMSKRPLLTTHT